jgi:hypothetical protein
MESLKWRDVPNHQSLEWRPADNLPDLSGLGVPPDATIHKVSVCKKKRLYGTREGQMFCLILFDRKHDVQP